MSEVTARVPVESLGQAVHADREIPESMIVPCQRPGKIGPVGKESWHLEPALRRALGPIDERLR